MDSGDDFTTRSLNNRRSFDLRGHKSEAIGLATLKIYFKTSFFGSVQSLRLRSDKIRGLESAQFSARGLEVTALSSILNKFEDRASLRPAGAVSPGSTMLSEPPSNTIYISYLNVLVFCLARVTTALVFSL